MFAKLENKKKTFLGGNEVRWFHGLRAGGAWRLRRLVQPANGQHHLLPIRLPLVQINQHVEVCQQSGTELAQHAAAARGQSQEPSLEIYCPIRGVIIHVTVREMSPNKVFEKAIERHRKTWERELTLTKISSFRKRIKTSSMKTCCTLN